MIQSKLKDKLKQNRTLIGTFVKINHPSVVEIIGQCGLDFIIIDTEHSNFSNVDVERLITAADVHQLPVIVRVQDDTKASLLHALDSGATGIQVPDLNSVEQIKAVVENSKYYPEGSRGLSYAQRAAGFGKKGGPEFIKLSNDKTIISIHIENMNTANVIDEICKIPQVDVVFIGPADLSQSMGFPGQMDEPELISVIENIIRIAQENGKQIGIYVGNAKAYEKYKEMGVTYFAWKSDMLFLTTALTDAYEEISLEKF